MKKTLFTVGIIILINVVLKAQTPNTYPNNGNVGLGTTNPTSKVQICGDVKIDSSLTVKEDIEAKQDIKVDVEFQEKSGRKIFSIRPHVLND